MQIYNDQLSSVCLLYKTETTEIGNCLSNNNNNNVFGSSTNSLTLIHKQMTVIKSVHVLVTVTHHCL